MKRIFLSVFVLLAFAFVKAEVVLPKIFSDNMLLQRQMPVKIWGKADANSVIGIAFAGQKVETKAKEDGSWSMQLRPLKASSVPLVMRIYENGDLAREIKNVLVGEVWVAGGQSNMQWSLAQIKVLEKDIIRGDKPMIRMFTQVHDAASQKPEFDCLEGAKWEVCRPENFRDFSAISFFFAEELSLKLKVPVAIVQSALGGTRMITWLAKEDVEECPAFKKELDIFNELNKQGYNYEKALKEWEKKRKSVIAARKQAKQNKEESTLQPPKKPHPLSPLSLLETPSYLYNAKIAPIAEYTARGFIWYQGESDAYDDENFTRKFEALIRSWRKYWAKPMPFYFVQLPSYAKAKDNWAQTRWSQYLALKNMRLVEMAVCLDKGEEKNIHPSDKEEIAHRLAKIAQKRIYNNRFMTGEYGPMFKEAQYEANQVQISFNLFGRKLEQKGDLRGFEILVDDEWIAPASSQVDLENEIVTLLALEGEEIKAVRYLWKSWAKPDISLYSDLGLPAMSFIDEKCSKKAELNQGANKPPFVNKPPFANKQNKQKAIHIDDDLEKDILPVLAKKDRVQKKVKAKVKPKAKIDENL